jgi:hypothetical protein
MKLKIKLGSKRAEFLRVKFTALGKSLMSKIALSKD